MLQMVGQYGWGCVNEKYPATVARALFTDMIRQQAPRIFRNHPLFAGVDWDEFGTRPDFWVNILLNRPDMQSADYADTGVAIVNARFWHELEPLRQAGFMHFHVKCSLQTRKERLNGAWSETLDADTSESMATELDDRMDPEYRVIWNDHVAKPLASAYILTEDFVGVVEMMRHEIR